MQRASIRRRPWLPAAVAAATLLLAAAGAGAGNVHGQLGATPTATRIATASASAAAPNAPQPAPTLDDETAVRMILPASIQDSVRLPVYKWARADLPIAPGGHVVFIATIYPIYDGRGGETDWLLVNYLQWDGTEWLIGSPGNPGVQLTGDDQWLAQNLTDITAFAPPPGQAWQAVTVYYTAEGQVSPTLSRTETVVEIYDLTLTTVWSRVYSLDEVDTGNAGYADERTENVDWNFQDVDGDGIDEIVAVVQDSDTITLTGGSASTTLPAAGTTQTTTTEIWKWTNGVYVLQNTLQGSGLPAATRPAATATPQPGAPVRQATPARSTPSPTPTPASGGGPRG